LRLISLLLVLALLGGVAYWYLSASRPVARDPASGQVVGPSAAPEAGGAAPAATLNKVRGAAARSEGEGLRRAGELEAKTAP